MFFQPTKYRTESVFGDPFTLIDKVVTSQSSGFPPYNIAVDLEKKSYTIEIAIAGFSKDEIQIETSGNQLSITGSKELPCNKKTYLTQGIAYRDFTRTFNLASNLIVYDAVFEDGLLKIDLKTIEPEAKKRNIIQIK